MSTQQYAPGPWTVHKGESNQPDMGTWGAVRDSDGFIVAELWDDTDNLARSVVANAHLIASAPELLQALEVFLESYVRDARSGDWGNWDPEQEPEVIAARAAIAKAKGRS